MIRVLAIFAIGFVLALALSAWMLAHRLRRPPRRTYAWAVSRRRPGDPSELPTPRAFDDYTLRLHESHAPTPIWDIEGDLPSGPIVIFTPGWGDSRIAVLPRLIALAPNASRVIAWDPPGLGEARGSCMLGAREDQLLAALARRIESAYPARPIVLYGSSLGAGASIVCAAAQDRPSSIIRVIAEGAYRHASVPARNVTRLNDLPWTLNAPIAFAALSLRLGCGWMFRGAHQGLGFDRAAHAARLQLPLLLIHADTDEVCPVQDARDLAAAAPNARLLLVQGGAHNNLWTDNRFAPELTRAVTDFVASA